MGGCFCDGRCRDLGYCPNQSTGNRLLDSMIESSRAVEELPDWVKRAFGVKVGVKPLDCVGVPLGGIGKIDVANQPWECPRCHRINAPTTPTCFCKPTNPTAPHSTANQ